MPVFIVIVKNLDTYKTKIIIRMYKLFLFLLLSNNIDKIFYFFSFSALLYLFAYYIRYLVVKIILSQDHIYL